MLVKFVGCLPDQKRFGANTGDPSKLVIGQVYKVELEDVHAWHTKYWLADHIGSFNSVCFEDVKG